MFEQSPKRRWSEKRQHAATIDMVEGETYMEEILRVKGEMMY